MKRTTISFVTLSLFFTTSVVAQKKQTVFMQWGIAAELPAETGQLQSLGIAGPVTGVINDIFFIVAGGANFPGAMPWEGGKKIYYDEGYVYTRRKNQLVVNKTRFTLPFSLAYSASCTTSEGVFFAGGENENGISEKAGLLQWDAVAGKIIFKKLPSLPVPLTNAAASVLENTVFVAGGETGIEASSLFFSLDLHKLQEGWKQLAPIPIGVSHTVLSASSSKYQKQVYLSGGRKKNSNGISDLYDNVYMYDVVTNVWNEKAPLPYTLCAGTGGWYKGCIIMFGGDRGTTFHKVESLVAAINSEMDEMKKQNLLLQKNKLQQEHPGFSNEVLMYNSKKNSWKVIGLMPFDTPVTTTAVIWKKLFIIPSGEVKAGVRTNKILQVKLH